MWMGEKWTVVDEKDVSGRENKRERERRRGIVMIEVGHREPKGEGGTHQGKRCVFGGGILWW